MKLLQNAFLRAKGKEAKGNWGWEKHFFIKHRSGAGLWQLSQTFLYWCRNARFILSRGRTEGYNKALNTSQAVYADQYQVQLLSLTMRGFIATLLLLSTTITLTSTIYSKDMHFPTSAPSLSFSLEFHHFHVEHYVCPIHPFLSNCTFFSVKELHSVNISFWYALTSQSLVK